MDVEEKLAQIFSLILERKIEKGEDVQRENEELWDSLKHIELMMTIEQEYGITLNRNKLQNLKSMDDFLKQVIALQK